MANFDFIDCVCWASLNDSQKKKVAFVSFMLSKCYLYCVHCALGLGWYEMNLLTFFGYEYFKTLRAIVRKLFNCIS